MGTVDLTALWVMYGIVVLLGIGSGVAALLIDRRPNLDRAREVVAASNFDLVKTALLSGGVARAVDAHVVDLVERGKALADGGKLTVTDEVSADLDRPRETTAEFPDADAMTLVSVRRCGRDGIDGIRRDALKLFLRGSLYRMAQEGLLVTPLGRQWQPMIVAGPTLAGVFFCSIAMMQAGWEEEVENSAALSVFLWLPVTLAAAAIWARRPGLSGPDPRTALGRDVVMVLRADLPADATQAQRVAVGGFAAMTDDGLRRAIQGHAADSRWNVRRRARNNDINATLAVATGMIAGGDGGGDSGDGGGGGD